VHFSAKPCSLGNQCRAGISIEKEKKIGPVGCFIKRRKHEKIWGTLKCEGWSYKLSKRHCRDRRGRDWVSTIGGEIPGRNEAQLQNDGGRKGGMTKILCRIVGREGKRGREGDHQGPKN